MDKFYKYDIDKAKQYLLEMYFGTDNPSVQDLLDVGGMQSSVAFNFIEFCATQKAKGKKYIYISNNEHPQNDKPQADLTLDLSKVAYSPKWRHATKVTIGGTVMYSSSKLKLRDLTIYMLECHDEMFPHAIFVVFQ